MKSVFEQGQVIFLELSRFKEINLSEEHNWTNLKLWKKLRAWHSSPRLRHCFPGVAAFQAPHLSPVRSELSPLRKPAMHACSSVSFLSLWPLSLSPGSLFPIHSINLRSDILSAWKRFLVPPPKAELITQSFEMPYLVEEATL